MPSFLSIPGVFSPAAGFEITVTGKVSSPKLLSDAANLYLVVQDFKKADADVEQETYDTPAVSIFADYDGDTISGLLFSLTGFMVPPEMQLITGVSKVAITVATRSINFINTPDLREIATDFTPKKGLDMIERGLNVMHFTPGSLVNGKDEDTIVGDFTILFKLQINNM